MRNVRAIMIGTLLCALASGAYAKAHYIEVWNPPEARQHKDRTHATRQHAARRPKARQLEAQTRATHAREPGPARHARHNGARRKLAAGRRTAARKVADRAPRGPAPSLRATPGNPAPGYRRSPLLPPELGPDGKIMHVSYDASAQQAPSWQPAIASAPSGGAGILLQGTAPSAAAPLVPDASVASVASAVADDPRERSPNPD